MSNGNQAYVAWHSAKNQYSTRALRFLTANKGWIHSVRASQEDVIKLIHDDEVIEPMWDAALNDAELWSDADIASYRRYLPEVEFKPVRQTIELAETSAAHYVPPINDNAQYTDAEIAQRAAIEKAFAKVFPPAQFEKLAEDVKSGISQTALLDLLWTTFCRGILAGPSLANGRPPVTYVDEIDAAQAGEKFLEQVPAHIGGSMFYTVDDGGGPAPRVKMAVRFDSYDKVYAGFMLTRDGLNRTQLTLIGPFESVASADVLKAGRAASE